MKREKNGKAIVTVKNDGFFRRTALGEEGKAQDACRKTQNRASRPKLVEAENEARKERLNI